MKFAIIFMFLCSGIFSNAQQAIITGTVFEDRNGNGILDKGETGIPDVVVSDQVNTAMTDADGHYHLDSGRQFPYIFISLPAGYAGHFYVKSGREAAFPLKRVAPKDHFRFIHASDTHVDSLNLARMRRFREMADSLGVDFIVVSGDLVRDALRNDEATASSYYRMYLEEIGKFKMPVYSVPGNHELFGIERDKSLVGEDHNLYGKKMYRHYLGPDYYSFNYGGFHFVAIDGVDYQNLYYYGGVDSLQLKWLERDLAHVPPGIPVVTFNHIPFLSPGFSFMDFENDVYYGPQLLLQDKQLRHRHIVYNFGEVWRIIGDRPYPLALAGHYHVAQQGTIAGVPTVFSQTGAITRPDSFNYNGFMVRSGFTLFEVKEGKVVSGRFIPLNLP